MKPRPKKPRPLSTRILLASSSPRRIDLLRQAGIAVESRSPDCDEAPIRGESPKKMVTRLAETKAKSVASHLPIASSERWIVIAADTTVVDPSNQRILGKPLDSRDAQRMLGRIAGKTHEVFTGFCVVELTPTGVRRVTRVVRTRVTLRKLSRQQIAAYVQTGEPLDKAGSYAAQGLGMNFIRSISGSYTNIVGLPMSELLEVLEDEFGFEVLR